jgi:hypothetical protein
MKPSTFTCPRCFHTGPLGRATKFCPRCGLADVQETAADTSPLEITIGSKTYHVLDRIAIGSICSIYRCRFTDGGKQVEGLFKIARDSRTNALVANEADILRRLYAFDPANRYTPFLPAIEASVALADGSGGPPRQGNVLRMHEKIESPDELYTLNQVKAAFPDGLDGRHVAWIWRRVLNIIGFAHSNGIVHGQVLPMHILIEPKTHKLLLVDWCCASIDHHPLPIIAGGYTNWYKRDRAATNPPAPALDVAFGARSMIELLGGDPLQLLFPSTVEPALQRHFERALGGGMNADAWKLLADFDKLMQALWGPRKFQVLTLPPKGG